MIKASAGTHVESGLPWLRRTVQYASVLESVLLLSPGCVIPKMTMAAGWSGLLVQPPMIDR